jgi:hypothetical protein
MNGYIRSSCLGLRRVFSLAGFAILTIFASISFIFLANSFGAWNRASLFQYVISQGYAVYFYHHQNLYDLGAIHPWPGTNHGLEYVSGPLTINDVRPGIQLMIPWSRPSMKTFRDRYGFFFLTRGMALFRVHPDGSIDLKAEDTGFTPYVPDKSSGFRVQKILRAPANCCEITLNVHPDVTRPFLLILPALWLLFFGDGS